MRTLPSAFAASLAFACSFVLHVDDARACSCAPPTGQLPADGSVVPPDVQLLFGDPWGSSPGEVVDDDGAPVSLTWDGYDGFWVAANPNLPLGRYTWTTDWGTVTFTVDDIDVDPIDPPVVDVTRSSDSGDLFLSTCGRSSSVQYTAAHDGMLEVVALADDIVGTNDVNYNVMQVSFGWLGNGACMNNWPDAAPFASTQFVVGAFDAAGRFSGWSTPTTATIPAPGMTCNALTDVDTDVPLAVILLLALLPRRRRGK